jgi:hypothetical protein
VARYDPQLVSRVPVDRIGLAEPREERVRIDDRLGGEQVVEIGSLGIPEAGAGVVSCPLDDIPYGRTAGTNTEARASSAAALAHGARGHYGHSVYRRVL